MPRRSIAGAKINGSTGGYGLSDMNKKIIKLMIIAAVVSALVADLGAFSYALSPWRQLTGKFSRGSEMEIQKREQPRGNKQGDGNAGAAAEDGFEASPVPKDVADRMAGGSYPADAGIPLDELRFIKVLYIDFDGNTRQGELVANKLVADDLLDIFRILYEKKYPIAQIRLIDDYGADDEKSMAANNTSAFCWREIAGGGGMSLHSYGVAVDINPLLNPYMRLSDDGSQIVLPAEGEKYLDRSQRLPGMIVEGDACYEAFASHGWEWGGDWTGMKDYQHFSKPLPEGAL